MGLLFFCLFGFLTSSSTTRLYRGRAPRQERLTIVRAATHETELGDHDFCLSRSHYTDTDPTCRERATTAGIEPGTSSPGVARSTAELPRHPVAGSVRGTEEAMAHSSCCFRYLRRRLWTSTKSQSFSRWPGGEVAQSVERATPGHDVTGSIPAVVVRSLLVGSLSV